MSHAAAEAAASFCIAAAEAAASFCITAAEAAALYSNRARRGGL